MHDVDLIGKKLINIQDSILVNSVHQNMNDNNKPKPPFLGEKQKEVNYTLVLDMDQTLIHYF